MSNEPRTRISFGECEDPNCGCHDEAEAWGEILPTTVQEELAEDLVDSVPGSPEPYTKEELAEVCCSGSGCCCDNCGPCDECEPQTLELYGVLPTNSTFPWPEDAFGQELQEVRELLEKKDPFSTGVDMIHNILVEQDGNFTIVALDTDFGPVIGVSKFNPQDVKVEQKTDKHGNEYYRTQTAYRARNGFLKAAVRAIDKLIVRYCLS